MSIFYYSSYVIFCAVEKNNVKYEPVNDRLPRVFLSPSAGSSSCLCPLWEVVDVAALVVISDDADDAADADAAEVVDADADADADDADVVAVMARLGERVAVIAAASAVAATAEAVVLEAVFFLLLLSLPPPPSLPPSPIPSLPLLRTISDCKY